MVDDKNNLQSGEVDPELLENVNDKCYTIVDDL